jgi:hypothetical protein
MTSREGFDAYTLYLGIKLHFHSDSYNFVTYNGKVKADINSFLKRKDKYHFGKLYKTYKTELQDFYIANLSTKDLWAGDLLNEEAERTYKQWKKRQQKLYYMFETEVSDLIRKRDIKKVIEIKNGQHPILLKEFMKKSVSMETMCILDDIIGFLPTWDRLIGERVIYPDLQNRIKKYKSFVSYDFKKYRERLIELCSQ